MSIPSQTEQQPNQAPELFDAPPAFKVFFCLFWLIVPIAFYYFVEDPGALSQWLIWFSTLGLMCAALSATNKEYVLSERSNKENRILEEKTGISSLIIEKVPHLRNARAKCLSKWGDLNVLRWSSEKQQFYTDVILKSYPKGTVIRKSDVMKMIDEILEKPVGSDPDLMDGVNYEFHCANLLKESGWEVDFTKASGDQGVDLIARKGDFSVAIQCKRYANSVSNSAVQQIAAGAAFYGLKHTAVVSTGAYTKSAMSLAEAVGCLLLHQSQLHDLENILRKTINTET